MRIKKTFREIFPDVDFPVLAIRPETIAYLTGFYSTARRPGQLGLCCTLVDEEKSRTGKKKRKISFAISQWKCLDIRKEKMNLPGCSYCPYRKMWFDWA